MCGFVGSVQYQGLQAVSKDDLQSALASIRHRGPDGEGMFTNEWVALAHARLAIIDLTETGRQPMLDYSGRYVIVFNGEIYNYRELYRDHCDEDSRCPASSDTAVLLEMYKRYGRACLRYLNGMFAFAIADLKTRQVFLARDRFGEKPLYWLHHGNTVAFSSELSALKTLCPNEPWRLDPESVALFHSLGSIPSPKTIYRDVEALRPGHWMEWDAKGHRSAGCYWSPAHVLKEHSVRKPDISYPLAIEETKDRLLRSARSRMVSDVPVGLFLSGGYDSGALMALLTAQRLSIKTALCIDFEDEQYSEFRLAGITAQAFHATVHRALISPESFLDGIGDFFLAMDQPTGDGYNTYFVSQAAKAAGIKVWLSGIGGDEVFGGYPSFRRIGRLRSLASLLGRLIPKAVVDRTATRLQDRLRLSRLLHLADPGDPTIRAYQANRNLVPYRNVCPYLSKDLLIELTDMQSMVDKMYPDTDFCVDDFQRATVLETLVYMGSQLLRDMDNFSMSHSIELRAPYLDHELFEYVLTLPEDFKQRGGTTKPLLANALPLSLPQEILSQRKRGFTFPVERWLKSHLKTTFETYAFASANVSFWNMSMIERTWKDYLAGRTHWGVIWNLYAFARWAHDHKAS